MKIARPDRLFARLLGLLFVALSVFLLIELYNADGATDCATLGLVFLIVGILPTSILLLLYDIRPRR